jgi:hypothetical protein
VLTLSYIPGFAATVVFLALVFCGAITANWLFKKYPIEAPDADEVVAREIEKQRQAGRIH